MLELQVEKETLEIVSNFIKNSINTPYSEYNNKKKELHEDINKQLNKLEDTSPIKRSISLKMSFLFSGTLKNIVKTQEEINKRLLELENLIEP